MTSLRGDHVAERLGHLAAVAVDDEAVREHRAVRGAAVRRRRGQQRAVEPAAVLVAALEVEVGGPAQVRARLEHGRVADAGLEPHVEDVGLLDAAVVPAAAGQRRAGRQELLGRALEPGVGALGRRTARSTRSNDRVVEQQRLAALLAVEDRDRHAPGALARDAPVGPVRDHAEMRLRPQAGIHSTRSIASSDLRRRPVVSIETNHCSVARKMTGCLQRQQCG